MKPFKFKGDWEFEYQFDAFKGLQSRQGPYTSRNSRKESNGMVNVTIIDELNDDTDPTQGQINSINFIIDNPEKIQQTLFKALDNAYPELKEMYGYDENDEDSKEWFPDVNSIEEFRKVFGVGNVFVMIPQKDNYSYIGLECGCTWDEEHGLGFLLHKDRLVKIGGADEASNSWEAHKDNGTYEYEQQNWDKKNTNRSQLPKPKIYKPHPKYGKLKPTQIEANKMYENHLIERGYNQEFINLVEAGDVDINLNKGMSMTFLERAAQMNNLEIVKFILSKNPKSTKNVIHNAIGHCNKELIEILINYGVDINETDYWGRTALNLINQRIASGEESIGKEWYKKYKYFANWLELKGAK